MGSGMDNRASAAPAHVGRLGLHQYPYWARACSLLCCLPLRISGVIVVVVDVAVVVGVDVCGVAVGSAMCSFCILLLNCTALLREIPF